MSDPLDRMKRLVEEGPPPVPLPPHEVRRWGDRIRRRRTAWGAIGVAAAVAMVASGGVLVSQEVAGTAERVDTASQAPSPIRDSEPPPETAPPAPSPKGGWRTEIPADFPLEAGLPEPGGDTPAWSVSQDVHQSWRNLPCPTDRDGFETTLPQDSQRTDARTIIAEPPAAVESRQLALFVDEATAMAAVESIRAVAESCGPVEGVRGSTELRYTVTDVAFGDSGGFLIAGGEYVSDNDSRAPGRTLHSVVRVGNAVFVGGLSDESDAEPLDLSDPDASNLQHATTQIAGAMCVFAADPCPRPTASAERSPSASQKSPAQPAQPSAAEPEAPSPSAPEEPVHTGPVDPGPAVQPVLGAENLVSAGDLPALEDERRWWRAVAPRSAPTLSCQAERLSALGADELLYREFRTPPHRRSDYSTAAINTAVLAFDSRAAASAAYTTVLGWVQDCDPRLDNSRPVASNGEEAIRPSINGGRATWRSVHLYATDVCEECDAIWFDRQGVAQVGERLMLVSLTKLGGPLEPRSLNVAMNQVLRAVIQTGRS